MVDLNPEIWDNPTLGAAANNRSLTEVEAQLKENDSARKEGRDPLIAVNEEKYPQFAPSGSVPSDVNPVELIGYAEAVSKGINPDLAVNIYNSTPSVESKDAPLSGVGEKEARTVKKTSSGTRKG